MKKVFISIPLAHRSIEQVKQYWNASVSQVNKYLQEPVEIIQSLTSDPVPKGVNSNSLWYLGRSLELLSMADIAYFSSGWDTARGCKLEYQAAWEYGIDILTYESVTRVLEYRELEAKRQ